MEKGPTDPGSRRNAVLVLVFLVIVNTVNYMDRNVINILLPRIKDHLLLSDTALGLIGGAAFTAFYAVAALPIGWAVDRYSRRLILAAGLLVWSVATFASGAAATFALLFVARAFTGSGEATAHPAGVSLISDYFTARRRTMAIAIFQAGIALGGGIGVIVGGHITAALDWRCTLIIFAFAGAVIVPFVIMLPEPARGAADSIGAGSRSTTTPGYLATIRKFLGIRTLLLHYAATVCIMFALQGYVVWMPSFLERHRGFSLEQVSNLAGAATLVGGIVGGVLGGWLADWLYSKDRRGRLFLQTISALLAAPCMLATVFIPGRAFIILGLFAAMILLVVEFPILSAIIVDLVDPGDRGKAMSILLFAQTGIGFSLGPLVVGRISDMTGNLALGLAAPPVALAAVVVLSLFALSSVRRDVAARERREKTLV